MDIPRIFTISESEHRIHNPFTEEKYAARKNSASANACILFIMMRRVTSPMKNVT